MKRRKTVELPTTQQIERLYDRGNIIELRKINERLAKVANQRRAQLYKSGIRHSSALTRMEYYTQQVSEYTSGGVFSRSKKLPADALLDQLKEILIFLRAPTSTVTGEKERRAERSFRTLTEGKTLEDGTKTAPYMEIPSDIKVPGDYEGSREDYFKDKFLSFLDQDAWKDIKKFLYVSEDSSLLSQAGEALARGASISDLNKAYKKFLSNEVDIYTMWDNWASVGGK